MPQKAFVLFTLNVMVFIKVIEVSQLEWILKGFEEDFANRT